jgi:hypothetical protein
MKTSKLTSQVSARLGRVLNLKTPAKIAAGIAVSAALLFTATLPTGALADSPSASISRTNLDSVMNDDFSMVFGTPETGPGLAGANTAAKVKLYIGTIPWNDDFSMVFGTSDTGLGLAGA